jgi:carboxypeptidase Q
MNLLFCRGKESVKLLKPSVKSLPMLGLGYSIGTSAKGITAKAIVVRSFLDLQLRSKEVSIKSYIFQIIELHVISN